MRQASSDDIGLRARSTWQAITLEVGDTLGTRSVPAITVTADKDGDRPPVADVGHDLPYTVRVVVDERRQG